MGTQGYFHLEYDERENEEENQAFLEIIPMDNDFIMVLRDGKLGQNALINIFDSQGRFIIEKDLPFPIRNGLSKGAKLYTIFEDKDGYKFVKRYGLRFINDT